jgi:8-hydroxy-5-deazaflavin:NADPH oxidoreductase
MNLRIYLVAALTCGTLAGAQADTIAMIGTGQVGGALGQRFAELGHEIVYGSRDPGRDDVVALVERTGSGASAATQRDAAAGADIVVLALPWEVVEEVARELGPLEGAIVVDPTNPRTTDAEGLRDYPSAGSNAERIQAILPQARVVKAFSTLGAETMLDPARADGPVTIPLVGDDAAAKASIAALAAGIGLEPVDVGPLRYARIIEGLHYLRYNAGVIGGARFNYYLRPETP